MTVHTDDWRGLYREGWGKRLCLPSYSHPAKAAYGLTVRIYEHALAEGWIEPGGIVLDPFAGIGGFALEAMRHGLHFIGCELEQRFADMGQGCECTGISKADWVRFQGRWGKARYQDGRHWCPECIMKASAVVDEREFKPLPLPGTKWAALAKTRQATLFDATPSTSYVRNSGKIPCTGAHHYRGNIETWEQDRMLGTAVIVQGDSRRLGEVLERASLCLSSPPYAGTLRGDNSAERTRKRIEEGKFKGVRPDVWTSEGQRTKDTFGGGYSADPANLGNLPDTGFEAALAVSSPVYIGNTASDDPDKRGGLYRNPKRRNDKTLTATYSEDEAQLAQMPEGDLMLAISSPPFLAQSGGTNVTARDGPLADASLLKRHSAGNQAAEGYGISNGQLAALPEGSHAEACERPAIAISSPPFGAVNACEDPNYRTGRTASGGPLYGDYGHEQGQLAQMPPGDHAAALEAQAGAGAETGRAAAYISSPPWENMAVAAGDQARDKGFSRYDPSTRSAPNRNGLYSVQYGDAEGQLGQQQGSTFWAASRQILEQVYQVLAPGGHAIFVCKRFVRDKKIVEFSTQWAHLCEAVGFKWIHHHKAWLVEDRGAQHTLEGGLEERVVKRFSFFRRLHAQKYPELEISYEDVLCFVKE